MIEQVLGRESRHEIMKKILLDGVLLEGSKAKRTVPILKYLFVCSSLI